MIFRRYHNVLINIGGTVYKALITDLDGSAIPIASNGSDIDDATRAAVKKAISMGCKIACATGRTWSHAEPIVNGLGIISPCIIEGGTRIVDVAKGRTLWEQALEAGSAAAVLDIFRNAQPKGFVLWSANQLGQGLPLAAITTVPHGVRFMYLIGVEPAVAAVVAQLVESRRLGITHSTPAWAGNGRIDLQVTHPAATKRHALEVWHDIEGITPAETIGLGDSDNDRPLFEAVALKIAPENASSELKGLADVIAPDVNQQALKFVIETYLLAS